MPTFRLKHSIDKASKHWRFVESTLMTDVPWQVVALFTFETTLGGVTKSRTEALVHSPRLLDQVDASLFEIVDHSMSGWGVYFEPIISGVGLIVYDMRLTHCLVDLPDAVGREKLALQKVCTALEGNLH